MQGVSTVYQIQMIENNCEIESFALFSSMDSNTVNSCDPLWMRSVGRRLTNYRSSHQKKLHEQNVPRGILGTKERVRRSVDLTSGKDDLRNTDHC